MKLLEPGRIGKLKTKNRVMMAPMGLGGSLYATDGKLSQRAIDYFLARAKGDIGLIRVGYTRTNRDFEIPKSTVFTRYPFADHRLQMSWLSELAERVHDYRAKIAIQLTAGMGRTAGAELQNNGDPIGPSRSECYWPPHKLTRELTIGEIERLVRSFGTSAQLVKSAGFDAIELHGHEGYLFDQFKTSLWNRRGDMYGGDLNGRLRFSLEVIKAIRAATGPDYPIIYRFGLCHFMEGGREIAEGLEIARRLEAAGVDALDIDAGCYETWYHPHPPTTMPAATHVNLAEMVKRTVSIPVIAVSKLEPVPKGLEAGGC